MADFVKLCEKIIDTGGNPSTEDVISCGYTLEHFIRLSQPNVNPERLVKNAIEGLRVRGIHYKEGSIIG